MYLSLTVMHVLGSFTVVYRTSSTFNIKACLPIMIITTFKIMRFSSYYISVSNSMQKLFVSVSTSLRMYKTSDQISTDGWKPEPFRKTGINSHHWPFKELSFCRAETHIC